MPKGPILYRETFFAHVRGSNNDYLGNRQLKQLEWNAVETELGTMVEPHSAIVTPSLGSVVQVDVTDNAVTKVSIVNEDMFYSQYGTGGGHNGLDYNT